MIVLHASRGFENMTRQFTTQRAATIYARRCAAFGWIVKALTVAG